MTNIVMNNMLRQCVYNNVEASSACPVWLAWVLGGLIVGLVVAIVVSIILMDK